MNDDENDDRTFFERFGVLIIAVVVGGIVAVIAWQAMGKSTSAPQRKEPAFTMVNIAPPPPPPPPPPPKQEPPKVQEPPKEEEMMEAPKEEPEEQPDPEPKAADEPPPLGTGIKGDGGPDGFGLKYGSGKGGGWGTGSGRRGGAGTPLGQFQRKVTSSIQDALRNHPKTRSAAYRVEDVRLWCDSTGRVTRVKLGNSTGNPSLDTIIERDVLSKIRFPEPPPPEARMPIVVKFTARRPN